MESSTPPSTNSRNSASTMWWPEPSMPTVNTHVMLSSSPPSSLLPLPLRQRARVASAGDVTPAPRALQPRESRALRASGRSGATDGDSVCVGRSATREGGGGRGDVPLGSAAAVHAPSSRIATARFVPLAAARTRAPRGRRGRTHSALQPPQPPPPPPRANAAASATSTPSATPAAKDRQPAPCGGTDAPAIAAWRAPRAAPAARCGPASAPHPAVPRPRAHADCDRSAEVQQHRTKKKKFARNEWRRPYPKH